MRNRSYNESAAESVYAKMSRKGGQDVTLFISGKYKLVTSFKLLYQIQTTIGGESRSRTLEEQWRDREN